MIGFTSPERLATARHLGRMNGQTGSVSVTASGLPAVRLYCPVTDPVAARFNQLYPTNHPSLSLGQLLAWPEIEAWVEVALVVVLASGMVWSLANTPTGAHRRRSRSSER